MAQVICFFKFLGKHKKTILSKVFCVKNIKNDLCHWFDKMTILFSLHAIAAILTPGVKKLSWSVSKSTGVYWIQSNTGRVLWKSQLISFLCYSIIYVFISGMSATAFDLTLKTRLDSRTLTPSCR